VDFETLGQLLSVTAVAALLGVPVPTLEAWRRLRIGPPAIRVGRVVVWRVPSVAAWVADGGALEYGIDLPPSGNGVGDDLRIAGGVGSEGQGATA
jgi:predicted DNA-binding transcriptional regulator AlpA